jgi:histidine ammonia-lyase
MLTPELNHGLPAMLIPTSGLDGGLMMVQYTAAALVSDNKTLAHPDSVDSIPSCANQEDHVSMGANAARHTLEILDNVGKVLGIEMLTAVQAIDLRPLGAAGLGEGTVKAYVAIRRQAAFMEHDRETSSDINGLGELIRSGEVLRDISGMVRLG